MLKRVLALTTSIVLALTSVAVATSANDQSIDWTHEGNKLTGYTGSDTSIVLPTEIDGTELTTLETKLFQKNDKITSVVIPEGYTTFGHYIFDGCTALKRVTLPNSITDMFSNSGFRNCTSLEYVNIPVGVTALTGSFMFGYCTNPDLVIDIQSTSITEIKNTAFKGVVGTIKVYSQEMYDLVSPLATTANVVLSEVTEPSTELTTTDPSYFTYNGNKLTGYTGSDTDIVLPTEIDGTELTTLGTKLFQKNDKITSVVIPEGYTTFATYIFEDCTTLKRVTLPDSITNLSFGGVFRRCSSLEYVNIPVGVTTLKMALGMFDGCTNPDLVIDIQSTSITEIKNTAFKGVVGTIKVYSQEMYDLVSPLATTATVVLVEEIDPPTPSLDYAELNQAIADGEAIDTSKYTEDSVKILTDAIAAGKTVKENTSATQTDVDNAVQAIKDALNGLVEEITVVSTYDISVNGDGSVTATLSSDGTFVISGTGATKDYNFSTTTDKAPWQYDDNAAKITSIEVKDGVTSLGISLFAELGNLESVSLPDTLTSIGTYCFGTDYSGKNKLTSVVIPESVTSIGNYAFRYSTSLVSVTLPSGLTSIPEYIFSGCTSLTTVNIPDTVTSIGNDAFYNCSSLTSITLLDSITSIGESAFQGCSSLTSVNIPSSLTTLGAKAFRECNLTGKVVIPEGITVLDGNIFRANPSADLEIYVMGAVTTVGTNPFSEGAGKIYVYDSKTYNLITGTDYGAFEIIYDGEVDTSDLEAVIAQAEALNESDYTASTWEAVSSALEAAKAELANEDKTSTSVMAATTALTNAIDGLIEEGKYMSYIYKNGNMATLVSCKVTNDMAGATKIKINFDCASDTSYNPNAAIDFLINNNWDNNYEFKGTYGYENGTTGCSETLELSSALVKGKDLALTGYTYSWGGASDYVYAVTSVDFLDTDGNVLYTITSDTVILDTTALESAIAKGEAVDADKYTAESYAVLTSAISTAKTLLANAEATQEDIDAAAKTITEAIAGLESIVITGNVTGTINVSDKNAETEMTVTAVAEDGTKTSVTATSMGTYKLENLEAGDYTLTISGGKYAPRSYAITVAEDENTQNVNLNPYGDINGDGEITTADVGMANSHAKGVTILIDYEFICANVKLDESITTADVGMINSHAKGVQTLW